VNRKVMELMLAQIPAQVTCAENGALGVEAFERDPYDLVVMDLRMPVMDGFEAMQRIREVEAARRARRVPIVVASAHTTPYDKHRAKEAGADEHVGKPIHMPTLFQAMELALQACADLGQDRAEA
jgi:CheY-like chemotaxis protein